MVCYSHAKIYSSEINKLINFLKKMCKVYFIKFTHLRLFTNNSKHSIAFIIEFHSCLRKKEEYTQSTDSIS